MKSLDLKVINLDRTFKDLVLHFFDNNILTIDSNENITGAKLAGSDPTLYGRVERVLRCANNFFTLNSYMNQLCCFIDKGLDDLFQRNFSRFQIGA